MLARKQRIWGDAYRRAVKGEPECNFDRVQHERPGIVDASGLERNLGTLRSRIWSYSVRTNDCKLYDCESICVPDGEEQTRTKPKSC